ncbi:MAG TPA: ABC transporter ATP-binding protein, partial [Candidatus Saccharimonadales bacterium]|nr:ABC transporter ATP-binding protein [Candidatus Saccharimonadales bacterium]
VMEELSDLHKRGNTIVMVTHNPNLTTYASRVIHMLDGKIASDTKSAVSDKPTTTKKPLNRTTKKVTVKKPTKPRKKKQAKK